MKSLISEYKQKQQGEAVLHLEQQKNQQAAAQKGGSRQNNSGQEAGLVPNSAEAQQTGKNEMPVENYE